MSRLNLLEDAPLVVRFSPFPSPTPPPKFKKALSTGSQIDGARSSQAFFSFPVTLPAFPPSSPPRLGQVSLRGQVPPEDESFNSFRALIYWVPPAVSAPPSVFNHPSETDPCPLPLRSNLSFRPLFPPKPVSNGRLPSPPTLPFFYFTQPPPPPQPPPPQ